MTNRRAVVGLDVGGTKTACGLFLDNGEALYHKTVPTSQESAAASIGQIASLIDEAIAASPKDVVVAGAGVIVPGWVNHKAHTVWAPNIEGWDHLPLRQMLEKQIPLPLILESDRCGYVKGEAWLGAARGLHDVVFLAVGTGIGAGIMIDGQVVHGHDDLAGAVGWLALNPSFQGAYRQMGCFEAEASGNSIGRKGSSIFGGEAGAARRVFEAADAGDLCAQRILEEVVAYLGMGVANLVSTLNPEMVVLGGGVFQSGSSLIEGIRRECVRWAQPFAAERVRIELSLLGEQAGLLGAARIALDNV